MINVNVKNKLKSNTLSVNKNGPNGTGSTIDPNGTTVCTLTVTQGDAEWVEIAVTDPVAEYPFMVEVPPGIKVSITSQEQGKDWTLTFTPVTVANLTASGNNGGTLLGEDTKVNVTVGQDIPPVGFSARYAAAGAGGVTLGLLCGHFLYQISIPLWIASLVASATVAIVAIFKSLKEGTSPDDTTQTK